MWRFFTFLLVVEVALAGYNSENKDLKMLDSIFNERPCLSQGGMCVIKQDCPEENRSSASGLCPTQQSKGIECCYGFSRKETRCQRRGGHCIPKSSNCAEKLTFRQASDCTTEQKCCILV